MKVKSIIFSIIILINTGCYSIYQMMILRAKWNASDLIHTGNHQDRIQILKVSKKDALDFDQDEVMYNGVLFDIVKIITDHNFVIVYMYPDHDEQNILRELANCFKSDEGNLTSPGEKILQVKSTHNIQDQILQFISKLLWVRSHISSIPALLKNSPKFVNRFLRVPKPPPEYFFI